MHGASARAPWRSLGVPWGALGPPGELLDHFWSPKHVQKLKSACLKSIEKPLVFIAYLRLGMSKSDEGSLKKRDLQQELEFVSLGGHLDGAWSICARALEVPRSPWERPWSPAGVPWDLLGSFWITCGVQKVSKHGKVHIGKVLKNRWFS